ncbi:Protein of unknown function [Singulisphaera sp. GP187]|uniref:DUF3500 domain-containing protein n=1 Tax=Singulisphaera sp. GP187 TaxID=1882752 RepID=UPI0009288337|nr:DUF3500 domain-containing protein [Singulisphaera sp. GP187]SIO62309.1 Protein of unknown function [Singulisphaera sp. GP187]
MSVQPKLDCPDCEDGVSRRDFVRKMTGLAVAGSLLPLATGSRRAFAAPTAKSTAETAVKRFYDSLSDTQRNEICFPFDHKLRHNISANWPITKAKIDDYSKDQQVILDEIFRGVTSPDGYDRFQKQMDDDSGGFSEYHVAVFGTPGSGQFEWEMTGRHLTIRADGDSVANAAFGGPIVYGHGAGDGKKGLPGNVFYYQTLKANEVFNALDGKQRKAALLGKAPKETDVLVQGGSGSFPGLSVGDLSSDQKELVESVLKVILAPYREEDVNEALTLQKEGGGLDALHMAFYQAEDLGNDQVWDIWRIESPTVVCHFRGAPHVHAYINIAKKA